MLGVNLFNCWIKRSTLTSSGEKSLTYMFTFMKDIMHLVSILTFLFILITVDSFLYAFHTYDISSSKWSSSSASPSLWSSSDEDQYRTLKQPMTKMQYKIQEKNACSGYKTLQKKAILCENKKSLFTPGWGTAAAVKWLNRWWEERRGGGERSAEQHQAQWVTALLGAETGQISPAALCGLPQAGGSLKDTERRKWYSKKHWQEC